MFQRLKSAIWRFMYGRYGTDKLNMVLLGSGVVLCLISMIARVGILSYVAYVPLILAIFRTFSRQPPRPQKGKSGAFKRDCPHQGPAESVL